MQQNTQSFQVHVKCSREHTMCWDTKKKSLNKLKNTEIISSIFSDHEGIKLEINYQKNSWKYHRHLKLNSIILNNCWFNEEIKEENKQK